MLKTIREDISRWSILPLSLWVGAEIIKMNIFPRISFLLSSIPLKIPETFLKEINKLLTKLLWRNKKPRISFNNLKICRKKGGLGIPDIYAYYLAFIAKYPMFWAYYDGQCEIGRLSWLEQKTVLESKKESSLSSL